MQHLLDKARMLLISIAALDPLAEIAKINSSTQGRPSHAPHIHTSPHIRPCPDSASSGRKAFGTDDVPQGCHKAKTHVRSWQSAPKGRGAKCPKPYRPTETAKAEMLRRPRKAACRMRGCGMPIAQVAEALELSKNSVPILSEPARGKSIDYSSLGETQVTRRFMEPIANTRCVLMRRAHPSGSRPPKCAKCTNTVWGGGEGGACLALGLLLQIFQVQAGNLGHRGSLKRSSSQCPAVPCTHVAPWR